MYAILVGLALVTFPIFHFIHNVLAIPISSFYSYTVFIVNTFLKPHLSSDDHQAVMENLYKGQAKKFDASRSQMLPGRVATLGLLAAQLKERARQGHMKEKPVWIDVGGGTGFMIETMSEFLDVPNFFRSVYLVDLSPSLLAIAQERFTRLGWTNVKVIFQDAREFRLQDHERESGPDSSVVGLITMSYSLSMIPDFFPVIDRLFILLSPSGLIAVTDFYVQNKSEVANRNYTAGFYKREMSFPSRNFWRAWFDKHQIYLDSARRDYMEYRFGSVLNINCWKYEPRVIPYYIWIGTHKNAAPTIDELKRLNASQTGLLITESAENLDGTQVESKAYKAAIKNLAADLPLPCFYYQNRHWRLPYDESMEKFSLLKEPTAVFTWEQSLRDKALLKIGPKDVILALTSGGDNIVSYTLEKPVQIHAVDKNPAQNHALELKLAAYSELGYNQFTSLFETKEAASFYKTLISNLSAHLSSRALQFWLHYLGFLSGGKRRPAPIASCHPTCLEVETYNQLSIGDAFKGLRIHTDELFEVLSHLESGSITIAIVLDYIDAFPADSDRALEIISELNRVLRMDGRVLIHSTSTAPWYIKVYNSSGFQSNQIRDSKELSNPAFASTWLCTKIAGFH